MRLGKARMGMTNEPRGFWHGDGPFIFALLVFVELAQSVQQKPGAGRCVEEIGCTWFFAVLLGHIKTL
jgi:hypothetical protein